MAPVQCSDWLCATPRPPVLLATNPPTDSPVIPAYFIGRSACQGCTKVLRGSPGAAGPGEPQDRPVKPASRRPVMPGR